MDLSKDFRDYRTVLAFLTTGQGRPRPVDSHSPQQRQILSRSLGTRLAFLRRTKWRKA